MAKSLFKNYNFNFDKNESKIIITFCNQAIKQMIADTRFAKDVSSFESIISKIENDSSNVKLTKDEKVRLVHQLQENIKFLKTKIDKAWFFNRWLYKSMFNQYNNILNNQFRD
jgi:hypothetical protein